LAGAAASLVVLQVSVSKRGSHYDSNFSTWHILLILRYGMTTAD